MFKTKGLHQIYFPQRHRAIAGTRRPHTEFCLMLAPLLKHLAHILPIVLKPKVLGHEIRDRKNRARGHPDHLNNLVVRVIRGTKWTDPNFAHLRAL